MLHPFREDREGMPFPGMEPAGISTNFMPILLVYVFSAAWAGIPDTIRPATPDREDCLAVNVTHDESPVSARYDSGRKMFQEHVRTVFARLPPIPAF